ncbi:response regulator [Dongia sp.]|uniref:response regulator n=1 Tax=Dongia sp. TaxID=1977262 RepID=UPI003751D702
MAFRVSMTRQSIYLVEQDDIVRDSLKVLLESNGFEVEDFRTIAGMPCDDKFSQAGCLMLGFDRHIEEGLALTRALNDGGPHLPVVFLVGRGEPAARAAAIRAGAFAYLERPVKESVLTYTVRNALQSRRQGLAANGTAP